MTDDDRQRRARLTVTASDEGTRLDQFISGHLSDLSRSQAQRLIRDGLVALSEGQPKPALAVWTGLEVDISVPAPAPATPAPEALPLPVLFNDADVAVIDKPAGMVVHPAAGHSSGTLVN